MSEITIKTSEKVEVTKAQAWAVEEGKQYFLMMSERDPERVKTLCGEYKPEEFARIQFIGMHFLIKMGDLDPWFGLYAPLNELSADELNRAILKGYIVKEDE
ncbi:hypothetical protein [Bacillus atrophaeus]|uniref:hypothetical protein n=1 Tax=Bacillus atrophaeus TaxID=1452 RepID=UPI003F5AC34E